jgi:hypothetical protein
MSSETYNLLSLIIQALIAFGTVSVAVLAIWGPWIRSKLVPPKLTLVPHNLRGIVTRFTNGPRVIYYQLKVCNLRPWVPARNSRVLLRRIELRGPDQVFRPLPETVPPQFVWSPAPQTPPLLNITKEQFLDFARLTEGASHFEPVLYWYPNNFQGFVEKNQAVRYCLEVDADSFSQKEFKVFEIAWNGKWTDNLDEMRQNLTIREVATGD